MILGLSIWLVVAAVGLVFAWLSLRHQQRPDGVPQWPAPDPQQQQHDFAGELHAIGVEAGPMPEPNYRTGEYPVVEVAAEPVEAEPVEHIARHAAAEQALISDVRPWLNPTLHTERTPLFHESGAYPVLDLDLSATNSWNRADLLRRLGMDEEAAA